MDEPYKEICRGYIETIYVGAKEIFCNGIYVKSNSHPCGWDFISFERFENVDDMYYPIDLMDINNNNYCEHEYENKSVYEIIQSVGMRGWCFEISCVDGLQ